MVKQINIIELASGMMTAVENLLRKVKMYFYSIMLLGHSCPKCEGQLTMAAEGRCCCDNCGYEFDPTIQFQRCSGCGGKVVLRIRRYQCRKCGADVNSRFLFDGLVFDPEYFQAKMAESRQRKNEQRERVRQMLAECRSNPLMLEAGDLGSVPGLVEALNGLTQGIDENVLVELKSKFDLQQYQDHICQYISEEPVNLRDIPAIIENSRLDLIWRFVAVIFLEHQHMVDIRQQGQIIWVSKHADRQGQDIFGETEEINGLEGLAC